MCYASPVMLRVPQQHPGRKRRGRGCCAISGRPGTPSGTQATRPRPSPAPKKPLSPIIPVDPRNSPVSPIIPVHTQKQGGGALKKLSATSDRRSGNKRKAVPSPSFCCSPLATRHSPLIPIISAPLATAALRVVPAPIFTTTLRSHVGAPTFLFMRTTKDNPRSARLRRTGPTEEGGTQEPV